MIWITLAGRPDGFFFKPLGGVGQCGPNVLQRDPLFLSDFISRIPSCHRADYHADGDACPLDHRLTESNLRVRANSWGDHSHDGHLTTL